MCVGIVTYIYRIHMQVGIFLKCNELLCNFTADERLETDVDTNKAIELATKAGKWSKTYLGTPLSKLPLDPTTVTEVLR